METKKLSYWILAMTTVLASGCASYRTNSDVSFKSTNITSPKQEIIISRDSLPNRKYEVLGTVEASVKKLTAFHKDPTNEQANIVLSDKARKLGADAVINVIYKSGVGFTSWGVITAKGTAVKFAD